MTVNAIKKIMKTQHGAIVTLLQKLNLIPQYNFVLNTYIYI